MKLEMRSSVRISLDKFMKEMVEVLLDLPYSPSYKSIDVFTNDITIVPYTYN